MAFRNKWRRNSVKETDTHFLFMSRNNINKNSRQRDPVVATRPVETLVIGLVIEKRSRAKASHCSRPEPPPNQTESFFTNPTTRPSLLFSLWSTISYSNPGPGTLRLRSTTATTARFTTSFPSLTQFIALWPCDSGSLL